MPRSNEITLILRRLKLLEAGGVTNSDAAYDASWNGVTTIAPSKNAVYDKIETKADALGADDNYVTDAEKTKLSNLSGTNTGDQDLSGYSLTSHNHTGVYAPALGADDNYVTDAEKTVIGNTSGTNTGDNAVNTLYSGLVTNAAHTGEVTGSGALTVDKAAITNKTLVTAAVGDHVLVADASDTDNLKKVTVQTIIDLAGGSSVSDAAYDASWNGDTTTAPSKNAVYDKIQTMGGGVSMGDVYPVGSVYIAVVSTNPATLLGIGTWSAFGTGRTLVGIDTGDTDFDTVEETVGSKTVASSAQTFAGSALGTHQHAAVSAGTPTGTNAAEATHTHTYTEVPNHTHTVNVGSANDTSTVTGAGNYFAGTTSTVTATTANNTSGVATGTTSAGASHNHAFTGDAMGTHQHDAISAGTPAGTNTPGAATSVVQPSIVVYMWKRTA